MKVNNISFGQTYYHYSLRYMNENNRNKLYYSYGLGDLYPVDIYLGSDKRGDLTVGIRRTGDWDVLFNNGEIPITHENVTAYNLIKQFEFAGAQIHGPKYPTLKGKIRDLRSKSEQEIKYEIQDLIAEYYEKYGHYFIN